MSDTRLHTIQQNRCTVSQPTTFRLKVWRRFSQLAMLVLLGQWSFYGIFRCPFLVPYVSCQNCPVITCHGRILSTFWGFWLTAAARHPGLWQSVLWMGLSRGADGSTAEQDCSVQIAGP